MTNPSREAAAELKVLTSNSSFPVLDALAPAFERASGYRYSVQVDTARLMLGRVKDGEAADVAVLGASAIDELVKLGIIGAASRRSFARSRVGVAVRAGAPKPDISSVEAFKRAMLQRERTRASKFGNRMSGYSPPWRIKE